MDTDAARRARRNSMRSLDQVYTDEEASPPEWVDLISDVRESSAKLKDDIAAELEAYIGEPDIRRALVRRETFATRARDQVAKINTKVNRLNFIAPNSRFTRA
ncbi:MAG: hypothetical protein WD826_01420, partial [Actinomycetota bacterium]